jgi:hypothetical protein
LNIVGSFSNWNGQYVQFRCRAWQRLRGLSRLGEAVGCVSFRGAQIGDVMESDAR